MDFGKLSLNELKTGCRFNSKHKAYICNYCEKEFKEEEIIQIGNSFYAANDAVERHVEVEHDGSLPHPLGSETKYNTLTEHQKELLSPFYLGVSDSDMAK